METNDEGRISPAYIMVGILVLIFLAYYPVFNSYFINYDDPTYVIANNHVKSGITADSIKWAFTTFYFYNWHPLTWISHMLDVELFGLDPMWHHLTNLLFHVVNSLLLFLLFEKMTGASWKSLCLASLFALHPLHVESVAWVSERKDVLSTFFWFLTMLAYVHYTKKPKATKYMLCALFFILGLMAKPMLVTLPIVLLLIDYWPLERLRQGIPDTDGERNGSPNVSLSSLILEKVPLGLLSVGSSIITFLVQKKGGALSENSSLIANVGNALVSYTNYVIKMFWPSKLAVYYPYNPAATSAWQIALAAGGIIVVSVLVLLAAKHFPYLAVGWFWYLITLVPVIGFIRVGQHAMADRYTYIPLIGVFIVVIWGMSDLAERFCIPRRVLAILMVAIIVTCAVLTNLQARKWHDSITLFTHTLEVTESNSLVHKNLAAALAMEGRFAEALHHASESLRIQPEPLEYVTQGSLYFQLGHYEKAIESCKNSIALLPDSDKAHFILGVSYIQLRDYHSAIAEYRVLRNSNSPYANRLFNHLNEVGIGVPGT